MTVELINNMASYLSNALKYGKTKNNFASKDVSYYN